MGKIIESIKKDIQTIRHTAADKIKGMNWKKVAIHSVPYLCLWYAVDKTSWLYRHIRGGFIFDRMLKTANYIGLAFRDPLPSIAFVDIRAGAVAAVLLFTVVLYRKKNAKKYRKGQEYGSARWGTAKDIAPYMASKFEDNIILTQTEGLMLSGRPKHPKYARNKNVLIIGGSGDCGIIVTGRTNPVKSRVCKA